MTNSFEGKSFVSQALTENQTLADYVTQLMPQFNDEQIQETSERRGRREGGRGDTGADGDIGRINEDGQARVSATR